MTRAKRWTIAATVLGSGMVFLDSTIVPVALPKIGEELSSSWFGTLEAQSYVYYGYLLSLSALLVLAGALTDYFGRRRMFIRGLVSFAAASLVCGLAPNMEWLIIGRILQGATGAALTLSFKKLLGDQPFNPLDLWSALRLHPILRVVRRRHS